MNVDPEDDGVNIGSVDKYVQGGFFLLFRPKNAPDPLENLTLRTFLMGFTM